MQRYTGESYEKVLDESVDLFLTHGFEKTTVRMILDSCNIHSGSLYYLFSSKEEIFKMAIEAFYSEIFTKSAKLSRNYNDRSMIIIFPAAFLLYASSQSNNLARLLYQAHSSWPILNKMLEMAIYWTGREKITPLSDDDLRSNFMFLMGGMGNMIGAYCYERPDYRSLLKRYAEAAYRSLEVEPPEDLDGLLDEISRSVRNEGLMFIDRPIEELDEKYCVMEE